VVLENPLYYDIKKRSHSPHYVVLT